MVETAVSGSTVSTGGGTPVPAGKKQARAKEIAQSGIHTASDLCRFGLAVIRDSLDDQSGLGVKEGNLAIRAGNFSLRSAEFRRRHGEELAAPEDEGAAERIRQEALRRREEELTAELERIREQRSGQTV